jgi:hypothetical protein
MAQTAEALQVSEHAPRQRFSRRHPVVASVLLAGLGTVALLLSWFSVSAHLTGVEPRDQFIDCGPALIGRPSPLPDPTCADAYLSVLAGGVLFALVAVASLVCAVWLLARSHRRSVHSD